MLAHDSSLSRLTLCGLLALLPSACAEEDPVEPLRAPPRAGGDTTTNNRASTAFQDPAPNLSADHQARHLEGDVAFEATFVTPPADVNPGLGPLFNHSGCGACHVKNGRGLAGVGTGLLGSQLLVRVSEPGTLPEFAGGAPLTVELGGQLQDHANLGTVPEATVEISYTEESGSYPRDGAPYQRRRPRLTVTLANGNPLPARFMVSARVPPPVFGLGLLEAVPEAALEALADPEDRDGDGVSGRVNRVWSVARGEVVTGRFGWKSNVGTLRDQAALAYRDDLGVSNPLLPGEDGESEIDEATLSAASFYTQSLAVPARTGLDSSRVQRGEQLFREIGCTLCHVETLTTGDHDLPELTGQTIHPYTDLLLHNMGFDLSDGRPDFLAAPTEWRTPPLWGLGLTETVLGAAGFLHDGRARTVEEAILWHGGEATEAEEGFRALAPGDRAAMLAFLRSL